MPEIAARAHSESLDKIIAATLIDADKDFKDIDGVGATAGPGLIGGLLVGMMTAKAIAAVHKCPFIAVNHLAGHALTVGITHGKRPPYLLLLVSGGHTQLIWVADIDRFERLGSTIDDALGEAFDKTAKLLGLGFPGGPLVEQWAARGDAARFALPSPLKGRPEPNFSFSGLKTALRQQAEGLQPLSDQDIADLCASFQAALVDSVTDRTAKAMDLARQRFNAASAENANRPCPLIVAGGVAANQLLRKRLDELAAANNFTLTVPPASLCTDNAAMIAWAAAERLARASQDDFTTAARSRWPLDETAAPLIGSGKAGAKA